MRREIFTIPKRPTNKVKNIWNIEHIEIQNTEMNSICLRGWRSDGVRFVSLATCMSEHIRKLILPWIRLYFVGEIHTHFFFTMIMLLAHNISIHSETIRRTFSLCKQCCLHCMITKMFRASSSSSSFFFLCDPHLMMLILVLSCSPFSPFSKLICEANNHQKVFDQWDHTFYVDIIKTMRTIQKAAKFCKAS